MMLFEENRGLKIEKEFVRSIIDFLTDKGWIKENVRIKYGDDIGYNFSTGWGKLNDLDVLDTIMIPKYFYTDKYSDNENIMSLVPNLKKIYKFDLVKIAEVNNISLDRLIVLFCILHEIGHNINSHKQVRAFKENKTYLKELGLREEIIRSMRFSVGYDGSITDRETFDKTTLNYRKMTLERIADRYAMKFMKLYGKELCCMANRMEYESVTFARGY